MFVALNSFQEDEHRTSIAADINTLPDNDIRIVQVVRYIEHTEVPLAIAMSEVSEQLEKDFNTAVEEVKTAGDWSKAIPNDRRLICYAFFKQVTVGDVTGTQPWAVQFEARSKWDAWNKIKGTNKSDAMEGYVKEWEKQKVDFNMPK